MSVDVGSMTVAFEVEESSVISVDELEYVSVEVGRTLLMRLEPVTVSVGIARSVVGVFDSVLLTVQETFLDDDVVVSSLVVTAEL